MANETKRSNRLAAAVVKFYLYQNVHKRASKFNVMQKTRKRTKFMQISCANFSVVCH